MIVYDSLKRCSSATVNDTSGAWFKIVAGTSPEVAAESAPQRFSGSSMSGVTKNCGRFLLTNTPATITSPWTFQNLIHWQKSGTNRDLLTLDADNSAISVQNCVPDFKNSLKTANMLASGEISTASLSFYVSGSDEATIDSTTGELGGNRHSKLSWNSTNNWLECTSTFAVSGMCQAQFFNATSDRRAKTNISLASFDASALIDKLPIYTFNYKENNSPSVGLIAQDAAMFDGAIKNFSLVENEQATGIDGNYMSIKESKLVYILWKAHQEQDEKIASLEKTIELLESQVKSLQEKIK